MHSKTLVPLVLPLLLAAGCGAPPTPSADEPTSAAAPRLDLPPGAEEAAAVIDAETLAEPIRELSDDRYRGRAPGTEGDRAARQWIAERMAEIGLEPGAADGSWQQPFDIVGVTAEVPDRWTFALPSGESVGFERDQEFIAFSGVQEDEAVIDDAELVFVGYGIVAPEYDWDDLGDAELEGKVLVMLNNDPDWDPELFEGERRLYYGRWDYKYETAARVGASGAIIVHTTPSAGYPWQVVQTSWTGEQVELPDRGEPRIQIGAWLTEEATRRLMQQAGFELDQLVAAAKTREFEPVPLGVRTSLRLENDLNRTQSANVLGVLAGGDSGLARQYVVYSAHHDHIGDGGDGEDPIYNGALDNASGVSQLLAIAEAFVALPEPPARSILFAFVGAEESGLLGSQYYAEHPTVAPGRIAANVNFDGGNIWGRTRDVTYIGYGKSSLDGVVEAIAAMQGRQVFPDQFPDRGFFYRSDQFNFAKIGVPAIYLDTGTDFVGRPEGWGAEALEAWEAQHYHQPSDEFDENWSFDGMIEDARLGFYAGVAIANEEAIPVWREGDEFADERAAALEAVDNSP
jgi:Zn-dependent M28 family amino/carboxypeptidase